MYYLVNMFASERYILVYAINTTLYTCTRYMARVKLLQIHSIELNYLIVTSNTRLDVFLFVFLKFWLLSNYEGVAHKNETLSL